MREHKKSVPAAIGIVLLNASLWKVAIIILFSWASAIQVWADPGSEDEARLSVLTERIAQLSQEEKFSEAIPLAQEVLKIAEKTLGPDHPVVASVLNTLAGLYQGAEDTTQAEQLFQRAIAIDEKALGPNHPETATSLNNLAGLYGEMGFSARAEPLFQRALKIRESALGPDDTQTAQSLNNLAALYRDTGDYARAEPLFQRALKVKEKALGPNHPDVATFLNNLATLYRDMGEYGKAEPLFQRALKIAEKASGLNHPYTATFLNNLATLYRNMGDYSKAELLLQRALTVTKKAFGSDHPNYATCLDPLAELYVERGQYAKAEALYQQALTICEAAFGSDNPHTALAVQALASLYRQMGDYGKAEPLCQRALTTMNKVFGPDHLVTVPAVHNLGALYREMDNYAKAEPLGRQVLSIIDKGLGLDRPAAVPYIRDVAVMYQEMDNYAKAEALCQRALTITETAAGPNHPHVATILSTLGTICREMGNYAKAEALHQRELTIYETELGPDHSYTSLALNDLARLYREMGDYAKAELLLQRALNITEKAHGPNHPNTAAALDSLGRLYYEATAYSRAKPLLQRELKILERIYGSHHQKAATAWSSLAELYRKMGDYQQAEMLFRRAIEMNEKALGIDNPSITTGLDNLAELYIETGDCVKAELLLQRALKIDEKALGSDNLAIAGDLTHLASLYSRMDDDSKAESLLFRALQITEKVLGSDHPNTAGAIKNLLCLKIDLGTAQDTAPLVAQMRRSKEKHLADILSFTSEGQRLAFQNSTDRYALLATLGSAAELAETMLRQKGAVLDSLLEDRLVAEASNDPKQREIIEDLRVAKQRLMQLALEVPRNLSEAAQKQRAIEKERLSTRVDHLEANLAHQVAGLGKARRALTVTVAQVQSVLPKQGVLVELLRYYHYLRKATWEERYGAIVIAPSGQPKWVPLGNAAVIEKSIALYQKSVRAQTDEETLTIVLKKLHEQVWAPIAKTFPAGTTSVIASPDAELSFVSFATLLTLDDRFVGETYSIRYVASGRDLLREMRSSADAKTSIRVFANPDFGASGTTARPQGEKSGKNALRSVEMRDLQSISLPDLPWTKKESVGLELRAKAFGWPVQASLGPDATEAELRGLKASQRVLHLATHGFFLPETAIHTPNSVGNVEAPKGKLVNPMHRSGVAMAGARTTLRAWRRGEVPPTENDGILTAEEVGGLKLEGTWLVVLSACDTGSGEARTGEGVMGLRRGFVQAGGQHLLMTLWPVNDQITSDIMLAFYDALHKTGDAPQALADTQRDWLVKLRPVRGLPAAVQLAGPFIMSSQGRP